MPKPYNILILSVTFFLASALSASASGPATQRLGQVPTYKTPMDMAISGDYAYLPEGEWTLADGYLEVVNIANPATPTRTAILTEVDATSVLYGGITISGNYAYVVWGSAGANPNLLAIYDISNPLIPVKKGTATIGSIGQSIAIYGSYAYISSIGSGIEIFNVTDPTLPIKVGTVSGATSGVGTLEIFGSRLYTSVGILGVNYFSIFDLSTPISPTLLGKVSIPAGISSLTVSGNYAYVGTSATGDEVNIFDISNPAAPVKKSGYAYTAALNAHGMVLSGNYLYVTSDSTGTEGYYDVFDVSNPLAITNVGGVNAWRYGIQASVHSGLIIVAGNGYLDIFGPPLPDIVTQNLAISGALSVGNTITFSGDVKNQGSVGMDTTNSYRMTNAGKANANNASAYIPYIAFSGNYAYVAEHWNGDNFEVFDISNVESPVRIAGLNWGDILGTSYGANRVVVLGNYAYVVASESSAVNRFVVIDISNPSAPFIISKTAVGCPYPTTLTLSGNYAYIGSTCGSSTAYFSIFDISNPAAPVKVGGIDSLSNSQSIRDIGISGNYAYMILDYDNLVEGISNRSDFRVFDISNKTNPLEVAAMSLYPTLGDMGPYGNFGPNAMAISGDYAYIGTDDDAGGGSFLVVDISNPLNPTKVWGSTNFGRVDEVAIQSNFLYTINGLSGVKAWNISNPASPAQISNWNADALEAVAPSVSISNNNIVLARYGNRSGLPGGIARLEVFNMHVFARFCIDNPNCLTTTTGRLGGKDYDAGSLGMAASYSTSTTWTATTGAHIIYFCSDIKDSLGYDGVGESNEANNCTSVPFTVGTQTVSISPVTITVEQGKPVTLSSTANFSDGSMIQHNLNWRLQGSPWNWDSSYVSVATATQSNYTFFPTSAHTLSTTITPTQVGVYDVYSAASADGVSWTSSLIATITATTPTCVNGAIDPPTCSTCAGGYSMYLAVCYANCTNGTLNPPLCNLCPGGQTFVAGSCVANCTNGAINPPTCATCPMGQVLVAGTCVIAPACNKDGLCGAGENLLNCPQDCKVRYKMF